MKGKVVLLTGGSRGIGPVIAEAFAKRGAIIALAARSEKGLESVARQLRNNGTQILSSLLLMARRYGDCPFWWSTT